MNPTTFESNAKDLVRCLGRLASLLPGQQHFAKRPDATRPLGVDDWPSAAMRVRNFKERPNFERSKLKEHRLGAIFKVTEIL
jgi:hypothetical protein